MSGQFFSFKQPNELKMTIPLITIRIHNILESSIEAQRVEDVALNIAGVERYARKTCDCGQPGGHPIRVLNGKER